MEVQRVRRYQLFRQIGPNGDVLALVSDRLVVVDDGHWQVVHFTVRIPHRREINKAVDGRNQGNGHQHDERHFVGDQIVPFAF